MKRSLLIAAGLALALSVSAQNNPDDNKDKKEKAKSEQNAPPAAEQKEQPGAQPGMQHHPHGGMPPKQQEGADANDQKAAHSKTHGVTKANQKTAGKQATTETKKEGAVVRSTTIFRGGKQTSENITVHRSTRETTNVHFSIGTHPREWWLRTYPIVLLEGCYYYLANDGCWYPAYGFDPGCTFPVGIVFCE